MNRFGGSRRAVRWLTLGQAAEILGVDVTTLRGWADAGRVRHFRTPGGHRRFDRHDVERLLRTTDAPPMKRADHRLAVDAGGANPRNPAREWLAARSWFDAVPEPSRARVRGYCAELMQVVGSYLAGGRARPHHLAAARRVGARLGREVAGWGLTPAQSTEVFVYFQRHVTEALASTRGDEPSRVQCLRDADVFLGDVLQGLMEAYGTPGGGPLGAAAGIDR